MPFPSEKLREHRVDDTYSLVLEKEDLNSLYSRMIRYNLALLENDKPVAHFRTNTYEYTPVIAIKAESAALAQFEDWKERIISRPEKFIVYLKRQEKLKNDVYKPLPDPGYDAVIIQGSPRPDGNCAIMASWVVDTLNSMGRRTAVFQPDGMYIRPCTGCYQCYNYGHCVFLDDMREIYAAALSASLFVVISPVYTNTVPASLKAMIDRFQAYHAMNAVNDSRHTLSGLFISTSGRKGKENFSNVVPVIDAFMAVSGIKKKGQVLVDNIDEIYDVRSVPGLKKKIEKEVVKCLG
ncbi:MAG: flavodoxin family protein [Methanomicrobiaceae archaeon]|nr:flavodoxin family protein [Methanomicrobiaceae archaeon]